MADFVAAGTAHATMGVDLVPFYLFYSMFGFQRIGDLIWAAGDARARGFLLGATAGRTTLNGEGLQHQDGHSLLIASAMPHVRAFDPAFAFELGAIVADGMRRMVEEERPEIVYLTLYNEGYPMPARPATATNEAILRGAYLFCRGEGRDDAPRVSLLASGTIVMQALQAQRILRERFDVAADVYSVTSWSELHRDAVAIERRQRLAPGCGEQSHLDRLGVVGPVVAVSDYVKQVPAQLAAYLPQPLVVLGTNGFGRSDTREALRRFFEVDAEHLTHAALTALHRDPKDAGWLRDAARELGIDPEAPNPAEV